MPPRALRLGSRAQFNLAKSTWRPSPWVCSTCQQQSRLPHRNFATSPPTPKPKPTYITTPIFYVNAAPHVGHLYTMVLADILKRWQVLQGKESVLCTGTDEHGMKIQKAASLAGSEPKPFCDKGAEVFKTLAARAGVANDHFVRTTDPEHVEAVQYAWRILEHRGYIYTSKHEGWYSVSDETFYPQSAVQLILDPATGRKMMTSVETGKEVEWTSESNYHFRLSAFKDRLLEFYRENPQFILPANRMNEVVQAVSAGLEDLSISRPVERLTWGIRVPEDASQTIYVWLDALLNYISKVGYPWTPGQESVGGWPADCHVIGKDIVRFHCIYWPAFLMALDIPLPRQVLTHAHWTLGHQKMAKSTGNVVNPFFALDRFGVDPMRFYLAHEGGIVDDSDYGNEFIIERYKKSLQGGLGNLASRIVRGKGWNVRLAVEHAAAGRFDNLADEEGIHQALHDTIAAAPGIYKERLDAFDISGAVKAAMDPIYETNKYLQRTKPWALAKLIKDTTAEITSATSAVESASPTGSSSAAAALVLDDNTVGPAHGIEETQLHLHRAIYLCAEALRVSAILLQPYMPTKAAQLLDTLGVEDTARSFDYAGFGKDTLYGASKVTLGKGVEGVLFPPLMSET